MFGYELNYIKVRPCNGMQGSRLNWGLWTNLKIGLRDIIFLHPFYV
jgi:hypothetical protein